MERIAEPAVAEGDAVERIESPLDAGVLLICDHATNALPEAYGTLGLPPDELTRHIAYDIGAAAVTRRLAQRLGAPAVLSRFSRLLIDPNRGADDPTLVMQISDGTVVPGNAGVAPGEIERRLDRYWRPYRRAVSDAIEAMVTAGAPPVLLSVHSFTPSWRGCGRPWEVGILWDMDPRFAAPLIAALAGAGLVVGDNEPYDGALIGDTLDEEATRRGLAGALIEIRQDLIADDALAESYADMLAPILRPVLERPGLREFAFYRSRTGRHG